MAFFVVGMPFSPSNSVPLPVCCVVRDPDGFPPGMIPGATALMMRDTAGAAWPATAEIVGSIADYAAKPKGMPACVAASVLPAKV